MEHQHGFATPRRTPEQLWVHLQNCAAGYCQTRPPQLQVAGTAAAKDPKFMVIAQMRLVLAADEISTQSTARNLFGRLLLATESASVAGRTSLTPADEFT